MTRRIRQDITPVYFLYPNTMDSTIIYLTVILACLSQGYGQMGIGMGAGELGPADMAQLVSAVREIVHPAANPTPDMIMIATQQGGPPKNMMEMMQYTPFMVDLANRLGVKPPGANGTITPEQLRQLIVQRGANWMQRQASVAGMTGGEMGLGTDQTTLGGLRGGMGAGMGTGMGMMGMGPMSTLGGSRSMMNMMPRTSTGMNLNPMSMMGMGGMGMSSYGMMEMADLDYPMFGMGGMGGMGMGGMGMGGGNLMNMHMMGFDTPF